jgi:hypothetical protein
MELEDYLARSNGWLMDTITVYELAESTRKAMSHDYELPKEESWDEAPYLGSWNGRELLQKAFPLMLKTSKAGGKAARIVMGNDFQGGEGGKTPIHFANNSYPRVEATVARSGIVTQFELWKKFAQEKKYPFNIKQLKKYSFKTVFESSILNEVVIERNRMTHEIEVENDPSIGDFITFTCKCRWLANQFALYE